MVLYVASVNPFFRKSDGPIARDTVVVASDVLYGLLGVGRVGLLERFLERRLRHLTE